MIDPQSNTPFNSSLPQRIFQTLSIRYLLALSLIALTILASNWFVKQKLREQLYDAHLLDLAGQQAMLSQRLVKSALLSNTLDQPVNLTYLEELKVTLQQLIHSHQLLTQEPQDGQRSIQNSNTIRDMIQSIAPAYRAMIDHSQALIPLFHNQTSANSIRLQNHISQLRQHEATYLTGMQAITRQYEREAEHRVNQLIYMQQFLTYLSLSIIVLVVIFVFSPVARFIKKFLVILSQSRAQAKQLAQERQVLFTSLEKSHKYLSNIHFAVEQATLFAKTDCSGKLLYVSPQFRHQLHLPSDYLPTTIPDLLKVSSGELHTSLKQVQQQGFCWVDWPCTDHLGNRLWLTITMVPVKNDQGKLYQYLFLCIDITEKKEAIEQLNIANRAKLKQKIREQRMRSVLVLQAQEEERQRIAMDLHDNVGQSLTALKYNVEALASLTSEGKMRHQLDSIDQLLRESIAKVRQTSFHLMPSVLSDYGLASVLRNFAQEMQRITGKNICFTNHTTFDQRLEEYVEMNLYRIVQESLTNSLKYAQASQIQISLHHNDTTLWVSISDDGVGFEIPEATRSFQDLSGRGLGNMEERTKYLLGKFSIKSAVGKGTEVVIQVPLSHQKELVYDNYHVGRRSYRSEKWPQNATGE